MYHANIATTSKLLAVPHSIWFHKLQVYDFLQSYHGYIIGIQMTGVFSDWWMKKAETIDCSNYITGLSKHLWVFKTLISRLLM